jgi:hypothetical protein
VLDAEIAVDCALKEPAENQPGKLGRDGVSKDVAGYESIAHGEFDRADAPPFELDGTPETFGWRGGQDVGYLLRDFDPNRMGGSEGQWQWRRRVFKYQALQGNTGPASHPQSLGLLFESEQEFTNTLLDTRPEVKPVGRGSARGQQRGLENGLGDIMGIERRITITLERVEQGPGVFAATNREASSPARKVKSRAWELLCWLTVGVGRVRVWNTWVG